MALPGGTDLINRLNLDDPSGKLKAFCDPIAASALETIRALTGLALPIASIVGEAPFVASYNQTVITDKWPVLSLSSVLLLTTKLRIGTLGDLYSGVADVAIAARGDGLELAETLRADRRGMIIVNYSAGFDTLPADLLEVWNAIAMQYYHETKRSGLKETITDSNTTQYDRTLPPIYQGILRRYQRYSMP
jgi:hypothetical protein